MNDVKQKLGLAADASAADVMSAVKQYAANAAQNFAAMDGPTCAAMGADLEAMANLAGEEDAASMKALAKKFKKMGGPEVEPETMAEGGDKDPDGDEPEVMAQTEPDEDDKEPEKMAVADAEKKVMNASNKALMARLAVLEAAEKKRADEGKQAFAARVNALADAAVKGGYDKNDRAALVAFATANYDAAHAVVKHLLPKDTGAPAHLFGRVSAGGGPIGGDTDGRTFAGPKMPKVHVMGQGLHSIALDEDSADAIKALAFSAVPADKAKVDAKLSAGDMTNGAMRLIAARKIIEAEQPQMFEAERNRSILFSVAG